MAFSAQNEQGLDFRVHGQEWQPVDFDGIQLMLRPNSSAKQTQNARRSGWSTASRRRKFGH